GVLLVLKPAGMTSHDVVAKMRRILKLKRIGHTGTLDPQVTGVLPLCIGRATRIVEYIQDQAKEYEAEMTIGYSTDTEDWTGTVQQSAEDIVLEEAEVLKVLDSFTGEIQQIPPMYSAVKVNGKRLYELARTGEEIERKPRSVTIYSIQMLNFDQSMPYPRLSFRVRCSKGTYIRTLCVDIGKALGYPAVMSALERVKTGPFSLTQSSSIEQIEQFLSQGNLSDYLIPIDQALPQFPVHTLHENSQVEKQAVNGVGFSPEFIDPAPSGGLLRLYTYQHYFLGIYEFDPEQQLIIPQKVFH
ncbi:MAG: tRNA pseudouridine(55) synthase TruB, partial [Paenibacillus sp. RIFOXYA1_FULL_44_5]